MRLLIDTHILIWWVRSRRELPKAAEAALNDMSNTVVISAVSA